MQDKNIPFVKKVLLRLAEHVGVKGIRGLAKYLGLPESSLYSWISRNSIGDPSAILKKIPDARIEWLESGKGEMLRESATAEAMGVSETSPAYGGYVEAVAKMMMAMDEDTQKDIYLSVQKEKLLRDLLREHKEKKVG